MRRKAASTTIALSSLVLLLLHASSCCVAEEGSTGEVKVTGRPRAKGPKDGLHDQWKLGTLSRIAYLLAAQDACELGEGTKTDYCLKLEKSKGELYPLRLWAEKQSRDWPNLLGAAKLHSASQRLFGGANYAEAEKSLDQSIVLQLFPFGSESVQNKWHTSLVHPDAFLKHQRQQLADAFVLLAASCLEEGYKNHNIGQLLKSHFALDTAIELFFLDNLNSNENEYTNILHLDILGALEETIPMATSAHLREIVQDAGLDCTGCENDFDFQRKIMEAVGSGFIFNVDEDIRSAEFDKCKGNQVLQQSTNVILHQLSAFLSSSMLTVDAGRMPESLGRPCFSRSETGACQSYFSEDVAKTVQCVDVDENGMQIEGPEESAKVKLPALSVNEKRIANILTKSFGYNAIEENPLHSSSPCNNPNAYEEAELENWKRVEENPKEHFRRREEDRVYFQKDTTDLSPDHKGDDPIVPITLLFMIVFYFGSWMLWKNRKALKRRVAKYGMWNKELRRENSADTALLREAITSGDIGKLEHALGEVCNADPAVVRRARSLLSQKKKAKKEADQARARAKAAKQRASAQKREEKLKRNQGESISTAATIAAVRAKVERERQAESQVDRPNICDSSASDEDFMPVVAQQSRLRKRSTTGSFKAEVMEALAPSSTRKKSDTGSGSSRGEVVVVPRQDTKPARYPPRRNSQGKSHQHASHSSQPYQVRGGRRSLDKNGLPKGRDAYINFRKGSRERNDAGYSGDERNQEAHAVGSNGTKYRTTTGLGPSNERMTSHRGRHSHPAYGGSSDSRPQGSANPAAQRREHHMYTRSGAYNTGGGHQQGNSANTASSNNTYGSSLYQTDLIGSLVGSYSPFKASNGNTPSGMPPKPRPPPQRGTDDERWGRKPRNPSSANIPKHMRANSFPEVDQDFEVDLNPSQGLNSEGTVEWLPNL
ncbi:hypothetical protein HOP50_12g65860 [Chloropicon primus]|nr:hypothetical protein HOP50_12g65860 [Chloropicon primus]